MNQEIAKRLVNKIGLEKAKDIVKNCPTDCDIYHENIGSVVVFEISVGVLKTALMLLEHDGHLLNQLIQQIVSWAHDRNLINGSTPDRQGLKLMSAYGELCDSIDKNDINGIKDGIGDVAVVALVIMNQHSLPFDLAGFLTECARYGSKDIHYDDPHILGLAEMLTELVYAPSYTECLFRELHLLALTYNTNLVDCLERAYGEIKAKENMNEQQQQGKELSPAEVLKALQDGKKVKYIYQDGNTSDNGLFTTDDCISSLLDPFCTFFLN